MTHQHQDKANEHGAAEYVLGTMTGEERMQFERRMASDFSLQAEVTAWEERLSPMLDLVDPVDPPAMVWSQIQQRLEPKQKKANLWSSVGFWRNLGMVATALVLVMGLTTFGVQRDTTLDQVLMVTNNQAQVEWIVGTPGRNDMVHVKAVAPPNLPKGMVCRLWIEKPDGSLMPVGVLPESGMAKMKVPVQLEAKSNFKVSIEHKDNMPKQKPAGKIVFQGNLIKI